MQKNRYCPACETIVEPMEGPWGECCQECTEELTDIPENYESDATSYEKENPR